MAAKAKDLTGQKFGRLVVLERNGSLNTYAAWKCQCDCGAVHIVTSQNLRNGSVVSCGCRRKEILTGEVSRIHGLHGTREYRIWTGIIRRCTNPNVREFPNYGGRGIAVCDRWKESVVNFLADMGMPPSPLHEIERKDNSADYTPDNCKWATVKEQANNRRNNRIVEYRGRTMTVTQALEVSGVDITSSLACNRLRRGWDVVTAVETPSLSR